MTNKTNKLYQKMFVILTMFIGILVNVFLVGTVSIFKTKAAVTPVEIYFSPDLGNIPPDSTFSLMVDPKYQTLSFINVKINFNPEQIQLRSNVDVSPSPLTGKVKVTPMADANDTGKIEIVLFQEAGKTPTPNLAFVLARMTFGAREGVTPGQSLVSIVDESTQIVASDSKELNFVSKYLFINQPNSQEEGRGGAPVSPFKGRCASADYIDTAIGCIPFSDKQALASFFLAWGLGIGGGIAMILIVYAAYMIMVSSGDPKRLQAGKELLTAALTGLLFLIFAVFILRLVGVDILGIL